MGKVYDSIDDDLAAWIGQREMFFVATAPMAGDGLVNCSPKGLNSFRIIDPLTVAYADLTGSGIETAAHLKENGRIVVLFCSFSGPPKIVRLHGVGKFLDRGSEEFENRIAHFEDFPGIRGIIEISLKRISDSCGYGVPKFDFVEQRETLPKYCSTKGEQVLADYRREENSLSIDGLPGI